MSKVIFDASSFKNDLLNASRRNDTIEVNRIIEILNEKVYTNIHDLSMDLMRLVNELDPFDVKSTVDAIYRGLLPENKELFNPVNVIITYPHHPQRKRRLFGCFS